MGLEVEAMDVVGVLTPLMAVICASGFFFLYTVKRELRHSRTIALSFLCIGSAFGMAYALEPFFPRVGLFLCGMLNLFTAVGLFHVLMDRHDLKMPWRLIASHLLLFNGLNAYALWQVSELSISYSTIAVAGGILFLMMAHYLRRATEIAPVDRSIRPAVFVVGAILCFEPLLSRLLHNKPLNLADYLNSDQWITTQMIVIPLMVIVAISLTMIIVGDITRSIQSEADIDGLTGIAGRSPFERDALAVLEKVNRTPLPVSMIICDIDHFKSINDNYGHLSGDQVIQHIANLLARDLRKTDLIGRIGGEEFGILLWNADVHAARILAEQLRATIQSNATRLGVTDLACTASFGVAQHRRNESYKSLFERTDQALYAAKRAGRNQVKAETPALMAA